MLLLAKECVVAQIERTWDYEKELHYSVGHYACVFYYCVFLSIQQ